VHEQNAVMGRANRALARMVDKIASSFPQLASIPPSAVAKVEVTGNPVRGVVMEERAAPYPNLAADRQFKLLVFGGSQGASFFAEFMPKVLAQLPKAMLKRLDLTQQCRADDIETVRAAYDAMELKFRLEPFFMDMPKRIAKAHLVICRSGASTIAELGVIGRPAVMVPLPGAIDNDQLKNAQSFAAAGAGWVKPQASLDPAEFAAFLMRLRYQDKELMAAAQAALTHGIPEAASRLADVTEKLAHSALEKNPA
jgi:UDP-N-acetylglucosamine--N-acetylmuramyl-(pentapeptide) pyrophosphoryl-undecaprenol N-acetylglucosamine transferase